MTPRSRDLALPGGLRYRVLEWGAEPERRHTVVLVHGFLDLAWAWRPVVDAGLGDVHIVAPDMRGHGDSDRIGAGGYYHFADYIADLHAVIAALGRDRVSLVGHSMGGSICSYYAGTFPQKVHRLALLGGLGPPERDTPLPDLVAQWIATMARARARSPRTYADVDEAAARLRAHDPLLAEDLARELAERGTAPVPGRDGDGDDGSDGGQRVQGVQGVKFRHDPLHLTLGPYPFRVDAAAEFWRRIRCPVLLCDGGASEFPVSEAERDRRAAMFETPVERAVIPGAGHMMHRHRPAEIAALLARFLAA